MSHNGHFAAARECLAELRGGTVRAGSLVSQMRLHVLHGGFCLRDLGTSTDEIDDLIKEGAKIHALKLLRELREDGDEADYIDLIRESVAEAGCSLADIGTSEQELASFEKAEAVSLFE